MIGTVSVIGAACVVLVVGAARVVLAAGAAWRPGAASASEGSSGSWSRRAGPMIGRTPVVDAGSACRTVASEAAGSPRFAARRARPIFTRTTTATIAQMPLTMVDGTAWCAATLTATARPPTRLKSW